MNNLELKMVICGRGSLNDINSLTIIVGRTFIGDHYSMVYEARIVTKLDRSQTVLDIANNGPQGDTEITFLPTVTVSNSSTILLMDCCESNWG